MRRSRLLCCLIACCVVWSGSPAGHAQTGGAAAISERSVKAAFLCKFAGYVEWPDERAVPGEALLIGVLESEAMADELVRITRDRTVNDRHVNVRRLAPGDSLQGLHILFVGERSPDRLDELLLPARQHPILIVTEAAGALAEGSIINFTIDRKRVRFEVSLHAAERSRLKLSSRLLAVAQRVQRAPES